MCSSHHADVLPHHVDVLPEDLDGVEAGDDAHHEDLLRKRVEARCG
jgi:hypothetical protein